ncbi:unnamed protein product [Caenorhabditis sp. 36 PRJEB53466]|nr:unnamed protein product [Caenorhabditis sp. 36 PRJEB53466]
MLRQHPSAPSSPESADGDDQSFHALPKRKTFDSVRNPIGNADENIAPKSEHVTPPPPAVRPVCFFLPDKYEREPIEVALMDQEIWQKYALLTNEMTILVTGRELFSKLKFKVTGLVPYALYRMSVHLKRACKYHFKYTGNKYVETK